jgi:hypothetical protein
VGLLNRAQPNLHFISFLRQLVFFGDPESKGFTRAVI